MNSMVMAAQNDIIGRKGCAAWHSGIIRFICNSTTLFLLNLFVLYNVDAISMYKHYIIIFNQVENENHKMTNF